MTIAFMLDIYVILCVAPAALETRINKANLAAAVTSPQHNQTPNRKHLLATVINLILANPHR